MIDIAAAGPLTQAVFVLLQGMQRLGFVYVYRTVRFSQLLQYWLYMPSLRVTRTRYGRYHIGGSAYASGVCVAKRYAMAGLYILHVEVVAAPIHRPSMNHATRKSRLF